MKDLRIREHSYHHYQLVERLADGQDQVLYEGGSHNECLFHQLRYEQSALSPEKERSGTPKKFMGFQNTRHAT